ncbi:MAG: PDZ domain-containing protein, partial [Alphaproteobacteria bacterium]|nr:PDZ domain-containing protein [Alphaproteobacteria bacterium]
ILFVNDRRIDDSRDLARKIADYAPGTTVAVKVRRGDADRVINVNLGNFPSDSQASAPSAETPQKPAATALEDLGLRLQPGTDGEGVLIVGVDDDSDASEKGLREGDVITEINSQKVNQPQDVDKQVQSAKKRGRKAVLMVIKRGDQSRFVAVQLNSDRG